VKGKNLKIKIQLVCANSDQLGSIVPVSMGFNIRENPPKSENRRKTNFPLISRSRKIPGRLDRVYLRIVYSYILLLFGAIPCKNETSGGRFGFPDNFGVFWSRFRLPGKSPEPAPRPVHFQTKPREKNFQTKTRVEIHRNLIRV